MRTPLALWDPVAFGLLGVATGASLALDLAPRMQALLALGVAGYVVARGGAGFFSTIALLRERRSKVTAPYPT